MGKVIIDTGPIIASLNQSERTHEWVINQLDELKPPLYTCEAVIAEACFLASRLKKGPELVMEYMKRGLIKIHFSLESDKKEIQKLMHKYKNVPMSLADACLVRMSEKLPNSTVFTLDSDFDIYRKSNRRVIPTLSPHS